MASILTIDTSGACCSVALYIDGNTLIRRTNKAREHVRLVLPMIDALLAEAAIKLPGLDAIAFTQGPGSFTGLRIGLGVVQGLAFGAELPVIPVSTLQVMAQRAIRLKGLETDSFIVPAIDARMGELYWGLYRQVKGLAQPVMSDTLGPQERILLPQLNSRVNASEDDDSTDELSLFGVGDGWQFNPELICGDAVVSHACIYQDIGPDAEDIVDLAHFAFQQGRVASINNIKPIYLRNTISWKKRKRLRNQ